MRPRAGIIGIIRKPGEYQALRRLRGRKKPIGRIPQGFARDLLKKYRRTTGLARGSLFYLALFGRADQLTRNIYRSYRFSIAINNRIFLSIFRIGRPGLLRSGEKYPVDYVAYPPHAQVHGKFTLDKHRSFAAYTSLRMPELGMQGPVARAPFASLAGPVSTAFFPGSGRNLALYPAFRLDFLNSLYRHEAATRFPSVLYAAKTSGMIGSHSNWMRDGTALGDSTRALRLVGHQSQAPRDVVHVPSTSSETQERFRRSRAEVPAIPFRAQAGRVTVAAAREYYAGITGVPGSRSVSFDRLLGAGMSVLFLRHDPGRSWPAASGVKEFQHDTTEYTTTVIRPVTRFARSISSIRSMLSGRSTQVLRSVIYQSQVPRKTVHVLGTSSETQQQFRPSRAGVHAVPFQVQTDRLGVDVAGIGTPVRGVRSERIRIDVEGESGSTSATDSIPVFSGGPSGKAVSGSFPYHRPGRRWPVSSGMREFQHDTTGYTTTVVRPVTRFASSISSIRSILSGRSTQVLRPVSYQSQVTEGTVHVLGSSSEIQLQFRPSRIGIHTVPFRVQTDRLGIAAARIGTPILDVRQGQFRTEMVEESGSTGATESRPVSSGRPSGKAVSGSFPYHRLGRSWPSVSSGVKEFQHDTTGYITTVVRPVTRFASSISSIRSMLSGRSTQVLRPVSYQSPASRETIHVLGSSSETQQQFRPSRAGVRTVPFLVQEDMLGVDVAGIGTPVLDIRQGRIQTDVTGELGVTRALESRHVSSGGPSSKAVNGSSPYHGPSRSWPVVSVMPGPHKVLADSGKPFVRPVIPQDERIFSTAQLPPDAQPYKQDTKDVTPRRDNAFAAHWTEILHKPYTKTISQRIMRNIELINNHYVHRVMGQKPGGDGLHSRFFPREAHGFPWMPASRSRDSGLEMAHVPLRLPVASSGMEGHTKKEGAGTAPVQGSLQVKGPEMSGMLPVPEVDAHSLANRVYGLIVERVKRELELRGR